MKLLLKAIALSTILVLPSVGLAALKSPIRETLIGCKNAGYSIPANAQSIQSPLKKEASLIGMAYLNYIYQNDLNNPHFCQAMLLMNSQVPANTSNPYTQLFHSSNAKETMKNLQDVQLSFDYAIGRSKPSEAKVKTSINHLKSIVNQ